MVCHPKREWNKCIWKCSFFSPRVYKKTELAAEPFHLLSPGFSLSLICPLAPPKLTNVWFYCHSPSSYYNLSESPRALQKFYLISARTQSESDGLNPRWMLRASTFCLISVILLFLLQLKKSICFTFFAHQLFLGQIAWADTLDVSGGEVSHCTVPVCRGVGEKGGKGGGVLLCLWGPGAERWRAICVRYYSFLSCHLWNRWNVFIHRRRCHNTSSSACTYLFLLPSSCLVLLVCLSVVTWSSAILQRCCWTLLFLSFCHHFSSLL